MDEIKANTPTKYLKNIWYFLFATFCICWFILPLGCGPYPQLVEGQLEILYPFSLPFNARKYFHIYFLRYSLFFSASNLRISSEKYFSSTSTITVRTSRLFSLSTNFTVYFWG